MHTLAFPPRTALTRRLLLAALASAAGTFALPGCATEAQAQAHARRGLVSLVVVDRDSGQVVPTYVQHGRHFVPGRPGARYALRLRNLSGNRVLVVLSVDGVNVISGQTADWSQTGYVLDPGRSYDINGWRKSDSQVAAFEFAPIEQSYAALTGRPDHVGVIGMAVFRERPLPPPVVMAAPPAAPPAMAGRAENRADGSQGSHDAPAPAARAAEPQAAAREKSTAEDSASSRLGTAHGQREWSVSRRTNFERASTVPDHVLQLEYDSVERLVAAGVIPAPAPTYYGHGRPRPFPANQTGFVSDPPRW